MTNSRPRKISTVPTIFVILCIPVPLCLCMKGLLSRRDDSIFAAEMHEGEKAEQTVVVGIEVSVGKGHVGGVPQTLDKFVSFGVVGG